MQIILTTKEINFKTYPDSLPVWPSEKELIEKSSDEVEILLKVKETGEIVSTHTVGQVKRCPYKDVITHKDKDRDKKKEPQVWGTYDVSTLKLSSGISTQSVSVIASFAGKNSDYRYDIVKSNNFFAIEKIWAEGNSTFLNKGRIFDSLEKAKKYLLNSCSPKK